MKSMFLTVFMLLFVTLSAEDVPSTQGSVPGYQISHVSENPKIVANHYNVKTVVAGQSQNHLEESPQPEKKKRRIALKVVAGLAATFVLVVGVFIISYTFAQH